MYSVALDKQQQPLAVYTNQFLTGRQFANIIEARAETATILKHPVSTGSPLAKFVDKTLEREIIRAAQTIIHFGKEAYNKHFKHFR